MIKTGLSYYNTSYSNTVDLSNGKFAGTFVPSMALQTIPITKSYGYESLTHGNAAQGRGYFPILSGYPFKNGICPTIYKERACTGKFNPRSCTGNCPNGEHCCFDGPNCAPYLNKTSSGTCITGSDLFGRVTSPIPTRRPSSNTKRPRTPRPGGNKFIPRAINR